MDLEKLMYTIAWRIQRKIYILKENQNILALLGRWLVSNKNVSRFKYLMLYIAPLGVNFPYPSALTVCMLALINKLVGIDLNLMKIHGLINSLFEVWSNETLSNELKFVCMSFKCQTLESQIVCSMV